jgi:RNA polymerase sigma-70 factor (ECF subfamily)
VALAGPYQIQAAVNAVHSDAATAEDTDWGQILALYDQLLALAPTPVVALNRAVALAEVRGRTPRWPSSTAWISRRTSRSGSPAPSCCAGSPAPTRRSSVHRCDRATDTRSSARI